MSATGPGGDDILGGAPASEAGAPANGSGEPAVGTPATPTGGFTDEQMNTLATTFAPLFQDINDRLGQIATPTPDPAGSASDQTGTGSVGGDEMGEEFMEVYKGPRKFVEGVVGEELDAIQETLNATVATTHQTIMAQQGQRIDEQYGEGTFREVILPILNPALKSLAENNSHQLASQSVMHRTVNSVLGQDEVKPELDKRWAAAQAERAKGDGMSGMPGGVGRPGPGRERGPAVSDDAAEALTALGTSAERIKSLMKARAATDAQGKPFNLQAWRASQPTKEE